MSLFISPQASFHLSWLLKGVDVFLSISILYTFLEILGDFSNFPRGLFWWLCSPKQDRDLNLRIADSKP